MSVRHVLVRRQKISGVLLVCGNLPTHQHTFWHHVRFEFAVFIVAASSVTHPHYSHINAEAMRDLVWALRVVFVLNPVPVSPQLCLSHNVLE
jgi:hypothetical protein